MQFVPQIPATKGLRHFSSIEHLLSSGCDERIHLDVHGRNRYWTNPVMYENVVHRGSCTCGILNDEQMEVMDELLERYSSGRLPYEILLEQQTDRLKKLINYKEEDEFEVFYAPSGSDLAYLPILFSGILYPGKPILNIVSCPEELGSGTLHAVRGEFHAEFNQFEEAVPKGWPISEGLDIETLFLNARGGDGRIIDHEKYIRQQIGDHAGHAIIVNLVYGSKSGIEDNLDLIDKVDRKDIIWSVDMCQFRHSRKIIHRLLENDACVMITGSKFYQAPPFCGCMLVSRPFLNRLSQGRLQEFGQLDRIMSGYDFPGSIRDHACIPMRENMGLRLRWECSLYEMEQFREIPRNVARDQVGRWNDFVMSRLEDMPEFEPMPDQRITNKTIISFRVRKNDRYLDHAELKALYRQLVCFGRIPGANGKRVFFGQPVSYGEKSFLRLAIGSRCIREFIDNDEVEFREDAELIDLIARTVRQFN